MQRELNSDVINQKLYSGYRKGNSEERPNEFSVGE